MKVFDIHSDLLYDLFRGKGDNRFKDIHVKQYNNSVIKGAVWTLYSPDDFDLKEAVNCALKKIDWNELKDLKVILGFEGLRNLEKPEDIRYFYNLGFRHAMLT